MVAPENPPSSYGWDKTCQPSCFWLAMNASQASRWASSELKFCSNPSSLLFRV